MTSGYSQAVFMGELIDGFQISRVGAVNDPKFLTRTAFSLGWNDRDRGVRVTAAQDDSDVNRLIRLNRLYPRGSGQRLSLAAR